MSQAKAVGGSSRRGDTPFGGGDPDIEAIRAALEGPVIEVMRHEIAELKHLARPAAYEAVMNDPKLLDHCLRLFRTRPELFAEVVVDRKQQPVVRDGAILACGRSLADAVALVVRASARRYFRAKLDVRSRFAAPPPKVPLTKRLARGLGLAEDPAAKVKGKPPSRADALYRSIRDYLRFDWQVLLIPHYAPMTPALVADLGPRLLDIREVAELQALSAQASAPRDGRPRLLLDGAPRMMMPGRDAIDAEILWRVVQQMDLGRLFPNCDIPQVRRAVAQVSAMHAEVLKILLPVLGDDIRRFAAFLLIAYTTLGEQRFKQDFCQSGQVHAVRKLSERLAGIEPPPPSLEAMTQCYQAVLSTAYAGGVEVGADAMTLLQARPALKKALDSLGAAPMSVSG